MRREPEKFRLAKKFCALMNWEGEEWRVWNMPLSKEKMLQATDMIEKLKSRVEELTNELVEADKYSKEQYAFYDKEIS